MCYRYLHLLPEKDLFMKWILLAVILVALIIAVIYVMRISHADEPAFTLIKKDGNYEIRQYPPLTIAEVKIAGNRIDAINKGFRELANYIFGGNKQNTKIAMTAPVIQIGNDQVWTVRFLMPATQSTSTLPIPNDQNISIRTLPTQKYIVICFSGPNTDKNIAKHYKALQEYTKEHNIKTNDEALLAFYNPPWIPPFMRRNEIMLSIIE